MSNKTVDFSTLMGIGSTLLFLGVAVVATEFSSSKAFVDFPSFLIVVVGTVGITVACFSWRDFKQLLPLMKQTIVYKSENPTRAVRSVLKLSEIAFRKGLMHLDSYPELTHHNDFLYQGILLVADSIQPDVIDKYLSQQITAMVERHKRMVLMLRRAGEIAPAMGLIGTLIGLVQMLGNLSDPSTVAPAMAVALLTTFYGAILSYVVLYPLAAKLERNSVNESVILEIYAKAMVSMARRENPRHLEIVLNCTLPSEKRVMYFD